MGLRISTPSGLPKKQSPKSKMKNISSSSNGSKFIRIYGKNTAVETKTCSISKSKFPLRERFEV